MISWLPNRYEESSGNEPYPDSYTQTGTTRISLPEKTTYQLTIYSVTGEVLAEHRVEGDDRQVDLTSHQTGGEIGIYKLSPHNKTNF